MRITFVFLLIGACGAAQSTRRLSVEKQHDDGEDLVWERLFMDNSSLPPTKRPSQAPIPTPRPSPRPTRKPTPRPTRSPTLPPTYRPTLAPTPPPNELPCGIPTELRAQLLTAMAQQISGTIRPRTPQFRALTWLVNEDQYLVCPDDPKAYQRYVLAVFYFSTDGDSWLACSAPEDLDDPDSIAASNDKCSITTTSIPGGTRNPAFLPTTEGTDAWLTPVYECEWAGVACRVEGKCLDRIEFGKSCLFSVRYSYLFPLIRLITLIILYYLFFIYLAENNGIGGTLPIELRDLGDLRFLSLERGTTSGTIPSEFGEIEGLLLLDLDFNQLTGTLPDEIFGLTDLVQLDLNDNKLSGTLSPLIGNLRNLVFVQLSSNGFTGNLPQDLEQLKKLGK